MAFSRKGFNMVGGFASNIGKSDEPPDTVTGGVKADPLMIPLGGAPGVAASPLPQTGVPLQPAQGQQPQNQIGRYDQSPGPIVKP